MGKEKGEWILHGRIGPGQLRTPEELEARVEELGFLPLFENEVKGFSVEEHTDPADWWTDNEARDPWSWREQLARRGRVAYGKFFGGRAGFIPASPTPGGTGTTSTPSGRRARPRPR